MRLNPFDSETIPRTARPERFDIDDLLKRADAAVGYGDGDANWGEPPKKRTSIPKFFNEVKLETRKVTWPSRRETWITSVMVAIMVVTAAVFFWAVDLGVSFTMNQILRLSAGS